MGNRESSRNPLVAALSVTLRNLLGKSQFVYTLQAGTLFTLSATNVDSRKPAWNIAIDRLVTHIPIYIFIFF
jgi:hypothetical protein